MDKISLLEQIKYYSGLLEKHQKSNATKKEKDLKSSAVQSLSQNSRLKQPSFLDYKMVKNSIKPVVTFDKKYSIQKFDSLNHKRTVLYNQNKHFKAGSVLPKKGTPKHISLGNKNPFKSNNLNKHLLTVQKKSVVCSKNKSDASSNESGKLTNDARAFIEEIKSVTQLLKKATESQPKHLHSSAVGKTIIQDIIPSHKNSNYSAFNKFQTVKTENIFPKTKSIDRMSKTIPVNNRKLNCYTKVNPNVKSNSHEQKPVSQSKFCYKKLDVKQTSNTKTATVSLSRVKNADQSKNQFQEIINLDSKNVSGNLCLPSKMSILASKTASQHKQEAVTKCNTTNNSVSLCNEIRKGSSVTKRKSLILIKNKSPIPLKSHKMLKLKPSSTKYTKINKHLTTPNKMLQLRKLTVNHKTLSCSKKPKNNINTKYKVINKTLTPHLKKKTVNSSNNFRCKENTPVVIDESDPLLKDLDNSAMDKLEKDLLAISTALTSSPVSGKCTTNGSKIAQHSQTPVNSKLYLKKMSLKKSTARISKFKIVNSAALHNSLKKKHNLINQKIGIKVKNSKFSLINKHVQPVCMFTPNKQKSILVRRLYKSKNTIINKNATPTSYSAKMIKSKYLTLTKRKSPGWQKLYPRVPLHHPKFKGYSLAAKLNSKQNRYRKTATVTYYPRLTRKFTSYGRQTLSKQLNKNINGKKYKRITNKGYIHSPIVFIHGMRYSRNSSGKSLRKLPIKGQTKKTFQKVNNKVYVRLSQNSVKAVTPTTNLASRVLHRSINRILTASSKKSLTKVNTYCMFYNRFGRCNRGVKCTYIHDPSKIAVCTRFLRGTCKNDGCPFSHEIAPGKMAICSLFLVGACDRENCPYRHEKLLPDAVLCKAFVQGYCPNGKECKKAHILICPKYMQGECDKGSSCTFPHPPQKAKKNVQKEVEDEEKKPTDVLLEKVFRYFQQGGDCTILSENIPDENNTVSLFVPKQRKLEEQPSFIPLYDTPETSHSN